MTMRESLTQMVQVFDGGQIEHALFTTFNFNPSFFERNVLPLVCGISMEDAETMSPRALINELYRPLKKINVAVAYDASVLQGVSGNCRYEFLPKSMPNGFFHAKIIVLAGRNKEDVSLATVMVSSGNLTISGWGHNIEVAGWCRVYKQQAEELLDFYDNCLKTPQYHSKCLETGNELLENIKNNSTSEGPQLLLQYPGKEYSLVHRLFKGDKKASKLHVFSPYWGKEAIDKLAGLAELSCYPSKDDTKGYQFPFLPEDCQKKSLQIMALKGEEDFRHAKLYYKEGWGLTLGSANCTKQALLDSHNVEAMLVFKNAAEPAILQKAKPLEGWNVGTGDTGDGPEHCPLEAIVYANYDKEKKQYEISVKVHVKSDELAEKSLEWWIDCGGVTLTSNKSECQVKPFLPNEQVARYFKLSWQIIGEAKKYLTGMILPIGGSDMELGYRPKRNLKQILEDMLRRRFEYKSPGKDERKALVDEDSDVDSDVDGDESESNDDEDVFQFDMYGMYQSFYHMRQCLDKSNDLPDTLQELIDTVLKGEEVKHPVQQWLMLAEAMAIAELLSDTEKKQFNRYDSDLKKIEESLKRDLEKDKILSDYGIKSAAKFMKWIRKELHQEPCHVK